ncbi:MAG: hypothetical protein ABI361_12665, partial [Nitrososphaera sp.]
MKDFFGFKADSNGKKLSNTSRQPTSAIVIRRAAPAIAIACLLAVATTAIPSLLVSRPARADSLYSTLTITSVSNSGGSLGGYFGLWQSGTFLAWNTGPSISYTLRSGLTYTIMPVSYGGYV